jgi:hypothetical protein
MIALPAFFSASPALDRVAPGGDHLEPLVPPGAVAG